MLTGKIGTNNMEIGTSGKLSNENSVITDFLNADTNKMNWENIHWTNANYMSVIIKLLLLNVQKKLFAPSTYSLTYFLFYAGN